MSLSDVAAKNAKPREAAYIADGKGLYLLVALGGSKYWRMNYRFDGKRKTLALGVYPDVALAGARKACDEARGMLKQGMIGGQTERRQRSPSRKPRPS